MENPIELSAMECAIIMYQNACEVVERVEMEIEVTRTSQYYNEFSNEGERMADIARLRVTLQQAIGTRLSALDCLAIALNCQKANDNTQLRETTLTKAA